MIRRSLKSVKKPQPVSSLFSPSQRRRFVKSLLAWYGLHRRDLPWRASRDPYRVWLSEIMLQQTRVAAVIEHYQAFLRRFPSVAKLAAARGASVLAAWSGLGYYRRARMLHAAAKVIARDHGREFPATATELRALPGIGRYTAAAIASIAFHEPVAVVDGNVERVLQRISPKRLSGEELWEAANLLLDENHPGDFNQAMMELGAIVCTPRTPSCLTCPVVAFCATRGELPAGIRPLPQKKKDIHYALHHRDSEHQPPPQETGRLREGRDGQVFLVQREPKASLMPGMWELPESSGASRVGGPVFTLRHSITVTDYRVQVWPAAASLLTPRMLAAGKWIPVTRLRGLALTGLARKILRRAKLL